MRTNGAKDKRKRKIRSDKGKTRQNTVKKSNSTQNKTRGQSTGSQKTSTPQKSNNTAHVTIKTTQNKQRTAHVTISTTKRNV